MEIQEARANTFRAAFCLMALFRGDESDDAHTGAVLLAEALRTIRDWDRINLVR